MEKFMFLMAFLPSLVLGGVGTQTFDFLRIPNGTRYASIGGCSMGMVGDPFALFSNPAGLTGVDGRRVSSTYRSYIAGIQGGCGVYTLPIFNGMAGLGVSYLNYGKIERVNENGNPEGNFTPQSLVPSFGYATNIGNSEIGMSLKLVSQTIDEYTSIGVATDLGYIFWPKAYPGLAIGGTVQNLGIQITKFDDTHESFPIFARLGGSYLLFNRLLQVSAELSFPERDLILGAEWKLSPMLRLRGGYYSWGKELESGSSLDILGGLSFGLGFIRQKLSLDYGITPKVDLGLVHRISLTYTFPVEIELKKSE